MCFVVKGDWTASVCDRTQELATEPLQCGECGRRILPGEKYEHIWAQEHEACRLCVRSGRGPQRGGNARCGSPLCRSSWAGNWCRR